LKNIYIFEHPIHLNHEFMHLSHDKDRFLEQVSTNVISV